MRLVLVFSGFLAAAVASATSDAPRGTLLSALTGRVDDAAAPDRDDDEFADVAAPGFEGDAKNVSTVELWCQGAATYLDDFSFFGGVSNDNETKKVMARILSDSPSEICPTYREGLVVDFNQCTPRLVWASLLVILMTLVYLLRTALNIYFFVSTLRYVEANWRPIKDLIRRNYYRGDWDLFEVLLFGGMVVGNLVHFQGICVFALTAGTPRPHAEQPRAVDGVGVSRCFFAGVS